MINQARGWQLLVFMILISYGCASKREAKIDRLFESYSGENTPGAAVLVIKDGSPVLEKAYGLADLEKNLPVQIDSNFRLASFTKQFTAMCIMILAERGKLTYETALAEIFPQFPDYGREIKIRNLLQHTSGLIDYESLLAEGDPTQVLDADVLNLMMEQDSTYFPPGSKYRYSNSAYAVLAMVVEKLSGRPFAAFLQEEIFKPLDMDHTVAYEKDVSTVPNRAYGYAVTSSGGFEFRDQSPTSAVLGDGGIYSNLPDLYKWDQALYTEKLVKSETLREAFTSTVSTDGEQPAVYGFGWRIDEYRGRPRTHHTGETCGFTTVIQRYPEDRFTVIILTNRDKPMVMDIADRITDIYLFED